MILVIDTAAVSSSRYFEQLTTLDGREYLMRFWWSDRESFWYLNLYDQDETPLALGIKLVVNWNILRRFQDSRLPPGLLYVADASGTGREIELPIELHPDDRCPLVYITADDALFDPAQTTSAAALATIGRVTSGGGS